jgi:hypothetical protein
MHTFMPSVHGSSIIAIKPKGVWNLGTATVLLLYIRQKYCQRGGGGCTCHVCKNRTCYKSWIGTHTRTLFAVWLLSSLMHLSDLVARLKISFWYTSRLLHLKSFTNGRFHFLINVESVAIQVLLHWGRVGNMGRRAQNFPVKWLQEYCKSSLCCVGFSDTVEVLRFTTISKSLPVNSLTHSSPSVVSVCGNCASRLQFNMDGSFCILESRCHNLPSKLAPYEYFGSRGNLVFSLHFTWGAKLCPMC